jgi:nitronate monooxygenase
MIKTAITEMFGIKYPVICGAMMWLCTPKLCAAVSNAGGMGNLTAGNFETEEEFRAAIGETKRLTDKPFMVGITILPSVRITSEHHAMYARVCAQERVAGIEVSGSPLDKALGNKAFGELKDAGVRLFHKVGSVRHAMHAEKAGYDGVYAAGFEEGGHPLSDDVTTMVLTPRIADSVKIPVVTVGGIADGRSMAAALTLGAQGVMMASRFIATTDCVVHENIKQELVGARKRDHPLLQDHRPPGQGAQEQDHLGSTQGRGRGEGYRGTHPAHCRPAHQAGMGDRGCRGPPLMVGQSIGHIRGIVSCKELLEKMHDDAVAHLKKTVSLIQ